MKTVMTLIGTRPEIIKMSPLIPALDSEFRHILVHSGQHYSVSMDGVFFEELEIRNPDYNLGVGSSAPGQQTAGILDGFEKLILKFKPDIVIVHGDTNTTLAGALAASKYKSEGIKLAHVEAGARSFNINQPEEINRRIVDQVSDILFAPYYKDMENLIREGVDRDRIVVTKGNTVLESARRMAGLIDDSEILSRFDLLEKSFCIATFHRQETVDNMEKLGNICASIEEIAINPQEAAMLEDLITSATNDALNKAKELSKQELGQLTGGLNIPGLSNFIR